MLFAIVILFILMLFIADFFYVMSQFPPGLIQLLSYKARMKVYYNHRIGNVIGYPTT